MSILFFLSAIAMATATSYPHEKNHFAYTREIEITDNKSVIDVYLNEDIYKTSKVFGLEDLAVFNSKNEMVTHQRQLSKVSKVEMAREPEVLKVFPIQAGSEEGENKFANVKVITNPQGAVVEIKNETSKPVETKQIIGYLVDGSAFVGKIKKLKLNFSKFPTNEFVNVRVEGSTDLVSWNRIDSESVLAEFQMQGQSIVKNEIPLQVTDYKYLRITFVEPKSEVALDSVNAFLGAETKTVSEEIHWLNGIAAKTSDTIYQYDLEGQFPVETLKIDFVDKNSVATFEILGSYEESGPWRVVKTATFYSMSNDSGNIAELQTNFPMSPFRYWQLKLTSSGAGMGSQFPKVQFGWRPEFIRFLARGEGPFTLAYGNAEIQVKAVHDFDPEFLKTTGAGTLKEKMVAGGDTLLVGKPADKYPVKKLVLWGVLIAGVLLLVGMIRQTKTKI